MSMVTRKRTTCATVNEEKSSVEKRREENIKANAAFLASLEIGELVKTSVKQNPTVAKPKKSRLSINIVRRTYSLRSRTNVQYVFDQNDDDTSAPPRKTRRDHGASENGDTLSENANDSDSDWSEMTEPVTYDTDDAIESKPSNKSCNRPSYKDKDLVASEDMDSETSNDCDWGQLTNPVIAWNDCLTDANADTESLQAPSEHPERGKTDCASQTLIQFLHTCKSMVIDESLTAKVTPKRIFSVDMHPAVSDSPLVVAGGKWGHVGLWNVNKENGICLFKPHTRPVNCSLFSRNNHHLLHTASYDGTVRTCDINKQSFTLAYRNEDDVQNMYMSEIDEHRIAVASNDGSVAYLDLRINQPCVYKLGTGKFKSISHHPLMKNYFLTGSVQGYVELWDDRKLLSGPPTALFRLPSSRGVLSAFFSPLTGEKILCCSADNRIRVYNASELASVKTSKCIPHDNETGRWLSNFRAQWHPSREDCFIIGSMTRPRQIEMFDCSGYMLHRFHDSEHLCTVASLNVFHPSLPVLAAGNASGKVHIFMDKSAFGG